MRDHAYRRATTVFDWENEPVEERPSQFASTTMHGTLSGYFPNPVQPSLRQRPRSGSGLLSVIAAATVLVGLGTWALVWFVGLIRH